jgi:hypothetical protein
MGKFHAIFGSAKITVRLTHMKSCQTIKCRIFSMEYLFLWCVLVFFSGCEKKIESRMNDQNVFEADYTNTIIKQSTEDFNLVTIGKKPIHSKINGASLDGSVKYSGVGYTLVVKQRPVAIGTLKGVVYGPTLFFDDSQFKFFSESLAHIKFYSEIEFEKLMKRSNMDN